MKRFLIFAVLFPPLALVIFNAPDVIMHHDFRLLDLLTLSLAVHDNPGVNFGVG